MLKKKLRNHGLGLGRGRETNILLSRRGKEAWKRKKGGEFMEEGEKDFERGVGFRLLSSGIGGKRKKTSKKGGRRTP